MYLIKFTFSSIGSIILKESPCVIGVLKDEGPPVCLGCSRDLMGQAFVKCPQCKWPMCGSKECWEPGSPHALGECDILKKAGVGGNYTKWVPSVVYDTIVILRCISLVRRPRDTLKVQTSLLHLHSLFRISFQTFTF